MHETTDAVGYVANEQYGESAMQLARNLWEHYNNYVMY